MHDTALKMYIHITCTSVWHKTQFETPVIHSLKTLALVHH